MTVDLDTTVLAACMDAWGKRHQYLPGHAAPYDVRGVFDSAYTEVKFEGETPIGTKRPMLGVRLSDFRGMPPVRGELFRIEGAFYAVQEVHDDGHGHLKIFVQETKARR